MNKKLLIAIACGLSIFLILLFIIGKPNIGSQTRISSAGAKSLYSSACTLQSKGELAQAAKVYQELIERFPQDEQAAEAWYKLGQIFEKENLLQKAKTSYAKIVANFPSFKQMSEVEKQLWDLNIRILFSPIVAEKDLTYRVEPGDSLQRIADKYNTTTDLIMRSNDFKSDLIRPGQRLKISTAKYSVIVDKSQNALTLKADNEILKVYSVATGKYNCTPTGTFKIVEKLKNPDWYKSGKGIISTNSPENILGSRWIGLSEPRYGIHGGAKTEDLGSQVTDGCIRMMNVEVEELFTILPKGSEVTIVD